MSEPRPGAEPILGVEPKAPVVVVERDVEDDDQEEKTRERRERIAELLEEDAEETGERIDEIMEDWNPKEPPELDLGIAGAANKPEPIWSATTYGGLKTGDTLSKVPKWAGYKGSSILTAIETWGRDTMKKNAPWLAKIPVVGTYLLGDVKKTWEELEKDEKKKKEADDKKNKSAADKAKKDLETKEKKAKADLKKAETTENKKTDQEAKNYDRMLESFMTPLEEYNYKNGDEDKKKAILKTVEEDLPAREAKRKTREYETMLMRHMTNEEEAQYKEVIREDDLEKDAKRTARAEFRQRVIDELGTRTAIAEAKQGNKKKGKGGGGRGNGKGKR